MELLFDEPYLRIEYDAERHWLHCQWKGFQTFEAIQTGGESMIRFLKEKNCTHVLNDNRKVRGSWIFASTWINNVWIPEILDAGLEKFAWIYSPDAHSRFSVDRSTLRAPKDIFHLFKKMEEAKEWLLSGS